jgi:hypothetical protein
LALGGGRGGKAMKRCAECDQWIRPRDRAVRCEGERCSAEIHAECVDTLAKKVLCNYCRWALAHPGAR